MLIRLVHANIIIGCQSCSPAVVMSGHSPELCRALQTLELPDCQADELALCQQFDQADQNRKWREGVIKSSFNYLLLDPRSDPKFGLSWLWVQPSLAH